MPIDASHQLGPDLSPKSEKQVEIDRLSGFPEIPDAPEPEDADAGVLLSDRIVSFCQKYKMIHPFYSDDDHLKAASYELGVGDRYFLRGQHYKLESGDALTIEPFDVAIIQTLETLNLPRFLIARWNLRIRWVYKGLLWVGAPQVDPGFRGFLSFPLYNLSNKPVRIPHGERIAAMDFVMTTPVSPNSKGYPWASRTRMVFSDYEKDQLESALATLARDKIQAFEQEVKRLGTDVQQDTKETRSQLGTIQSRVDNYTILTFTIIAVLFAALGLALSRSPEASLVCASVILSVQGFASSPSCSNMVGNCRRASPRRFSSRHAISNVKSDSR
jgi:deoxycytidine triphosphate deaminase